MDLIQSCGGAALAFLLLQGSAFAGAATPLCFNFDQPIRNPLKEPFPETPATRKPSSKAAEKDRTASGTLPQGVWGAAQGQIKQPLGQVYQRLLDHYTIKDAKRVKLHVYDQEHPGYNDFHLVMVELKPTPFVTLNWEEDWGYLVTEGTPEAPKKVVISYQKTSGTSYIPRLCGSIVLSANADGSTEVTLYEEIDAVGHRSGKETAQGHLGTLATLRSPAQTSAAPAASAPHS